MNTFAKFLLLLIISTLSLPAVLAQESPTAVTLLRFEAFVANNGVLLEWETGTEIDTAAFKLERADNQDGPFTFLSEIGFIAALGGPASGATYQEVDTTAVLGATYWYNLVEIREDQSQHILDTLMIVVVPATPTPTAQAIGGGGQNTPVPPTSTIVASSTPQPTATNAPPQPTPPAGTGNNPPPPANTATPVPQPTIEVEPTQTINNPTLVPTNISQFQATATAEPGVVSAAENEIAQVSETPIKEEYPGPQSTATATVSNDPAGVATPYPAIDPPVVTLSPDQPIIIGGNSQPSPTPAGATNQAVTSEAKNNTITGQIFLWLGFIFALIIFVVGVFFAIFITTRKQQS